MSGSGCTSKIITAVSPLLTSSEIELRLCLCDLFDALAQVDPSVLPVVRAADWFVVVKALMTDPLSEFSTFDISCFQCRLNCFVS